MVLVGFGVGFSFSLLPSASMHKMDYRYRGSANSTNSFFRSLGLALGITIFGAIQTKLLTSEMTIGFAKLGGGGQDIRGSIGNIQTVFQPETRANIPPDILDVIVNAMSTSISTTFFWSLIPVGIAIIAVFYMGNEKLWNQINKLSQKDEASEVLGINLNTGNQKDLNRLGSFWWL